MTKGMTLVCKLNGYVLGFAGMCLLAPPLLADEPDPDPITTVFLVCDGQFTVDSDWLPDVPPDSFDGTIYLSVTRNGDVFTQIKLQPFERKERLRSQTFVPNVVLQDVSAEQTPAATDNQFGTAENTHIVTISASNDEVLLREQRESGAHVKARLNGQPLVPTRMHVQLVDMTLNRFSGKMRISWEDRKVNDDRPAGAIRATKVTFTDKKAFDATCHTIQERLF